MDSTCLAVIFPWWKYPGEIAARSHRSLPRYFLGRSLKKESKKCILKDILHLMAFVGLYKMCHNIEIITCLLIDQKKNTDSGIFNDSHAAFSTSLS
jgi:hypothetical protein